jgi:hypothetical protein
MSSLNFINLPDPSSRTMALGLIQPLTEMSNRNYFYRIRARPVLKPDNLIAIREPIFSKM